LQFKATWGKKIHKTPSQPMAGRGSTAPVVPVTRGSINRRIGSRLSWSLKEDPISRITNTERAGRVAQEVDHLTSKPQDAEFNPQYCTPKNKE
jgi:hypothetical protein